MEHPVLCPPPPERIASVRAPVAALAPGLLLALALYAGEAAAQNVCRGGAHTGGGIISCIEGAGSSADILVNPGSLGIDHATANIVAVEGSHSGSGGIELRMTAGSIVTTGTAGHGLYARHAGATGGGAVVVRMRGGSIETRGSNAYAIQGRRASGTGNILIDLTGGSLSRTGATGGVVLGRHAGTGSLTINMSGGAAITATEAGVRGLTGAHVGNGDLTIGLTDGSIATPSVGIGATRSNAATTGNIAVTVAGANSAVKTTENQAAGVNAANSGSGNTAVTMLDGLVETTGNGAIGLRAYSPYTGTSPGTTSIVLKGGTVRTRGGTHTVATFNLYAHGVYAESNNGRGDVSVSMEGGVVETAGASANGLYVLKSGPAGAGSIKMEGGAVTTAGDGANGAYVYMDGTGASTEGLSIDAAGAVSAEGLNARGLLGVHTGLGSAAVRTGAAAEIAAPFAVGMEGRLTNDASAAGRIVVTHEGAAEAREVGVLARAARSSGYTMGPTPAADAARTMPMIHVTSSGDITVGASVTDAFIRARITGADETLSTGEQAVLSAITAGDSDALATALAALPDDYDADWKAEAQNLLRKRTASSAAPTGDGPLAHRAAEEILGLSRAGVRAYALSHTGIVDHIRGSDALSTNERAALQAVLTKGAGSELETALTALTGAAYTTAWKNTARQFAATYNAGDIRVDVTGGSIDAEGNGVEALYAVRHDSNGAIAVSVADGARVAGGANGIYVRNAGAGEGGLRAQSVTVNGVVTGGTGAGVRMIDGGRLEVGKTGRIGATSGVGVLSDGAGDLRATVEGTVEGDVRIRGGGALRLDVREGGAVTGTVRDPVGPLTVAGSIGRLLYSSGGAVTVTRTGALTGVEADGKTEAIRAESGDLDLTVTGRVAGDLRAPRGGVLRLNVQEGGAVAGTAHDPVGPLTVAGSIGRLLYSSGGAVTVTGTGRLAGVEVGGRTEALGSESGDLSLTVADTGVVTGDVQARGGGRLTVDLKEGGTISGTVHDPVGPLTVVGSIGRLLYSSGGAVTVARTGRLTGVDGVALRSESGNLDLTVAGMGMVTGDIDARGDGDLTVSVSGTVDGDIFGRGAGEHTVTVARGGSVTGTVDLGASAVTADGAVGRVILRRGGDVAVGATGLLAGVDGVAVRSDAGDLGVTVAAMGMATGDIEGLGAGDLTVMVAGTVKGDVFGRDAGAHRVTIARGGRVTGKVDLAGDGAVIVEGEAGQVLFERNGMVRVGPKGRIPGIGGVSIESRSGRPPAVTIVAAAGESLSEAAKRVGGAIVAAEGEPSVMFHREGETGSITLGRIGTERSIPDGAYDVGVVRTASGALRVVRELAPRTRVYEALPSVLLGMERLSSHADRAAAPRASSGAWARVDASRGSWEAAKSTNAGTEYDHRGFSFQAGLDAVLGEETRAGLSVHGRRATAEVSQGGEVEARGAGFGLSATWSSGPFFVDGQAAATLYDVDLKSSLRGALKDDVGAQGLSAALEAGRTVPVAEGVTVTPRARVAYSSLSLSGFDDSVGARVSLDDGRSLTGRAGALAERVLGEGGRIFGSVDVEREFAAETRMSVAGTSLEATGEETRYMVGVGGEHGWEEGRFVLRGALGYAASGGDTHDYGGRASLSMRF